MQTSKPTFSCKGATSAHACTRQTNTWGCCRFWQNLRRQSKDRLISTRLDGKEPLVKAMTNGIVAITSFHNHMGNVAEYLVNPT